jgi:mRNA interferase MazF
VIFYLGRFPFGDAPGMKLRPVLLLSNVTGLLGEVLVAYISSVIPPDHLETDMLLDPEVDADRDTKLKVRSVVRLHKLATIHRSSLVRFLGRMSPARFAEAQATLRLWLQL